MLLGDTDRLIINRQVVDLLYFCLQYVHILFLFIVGPKLLDENPIGISAEMDQRNVFRIGISEGNPVLYKL